VARGYMKHERETLEAVIHARNAASQAEQRAAADPADAGAIRGLMGAEQALTGALGRFFALAEAYPDLKANQNMAQLQEELASTENRIAFARQGFNDAVMAYNTGREVFPANLIAGMFGFTEAQHLLVEDAAEREAPRISFGP
jgi:LemA protein